MGKSSITWTKGSDWWLSRTTMGGKERYPKQIRVGDLDRPRVYYPVDRDALMALADEMYAYSFHFSNGLQECAVQAWAQAIREACGEEGRRW